jgi:hypothetical protein
MAELDTINRLAVPEITGHTNRDGIISYAIRQPEERLWRGIASDGWHLVQSDFTSIKPMDAVTAAITKLQLAP